MLRTPRFFPTDSSNIRNVWLITTRKGKKYSTPAGFEKEKPPSHIFIYGKGHVKLKPTDKVDLLPKPKIETYDDIYNLVNLYGYKVVGHMLGMLEGSLGDVQPFQMLRYFETCGQPYVDWLSKLSEIDGQMLEFFSSTQERIIAFTNNKSWRGSPYFGSNIKCALMGVVLLPKPSLDVIRLYDSIYPILLDLGVKDLADMSLIDMLAYMEIDVDESIVGLTE